MISRRAVVALIALVIAGCGIQPTAPVRGGPAVSVPGRESGIEVCFLHDEKVVPVERYDVVLEGIDIGAHSPGFGEQGGAAGNPTARIHAWTDLRKIGSLLALGPSQQERANGLTTEVPADLTLGIGGFSSDGLQVEGTPLQAPENEFRVGEQGETIEVVVEEPFNGLSDVAIEQISCTLNSYQEFIGEEREFVVADTGQTPQVDTQ